MTPADRLRVMVEHYRAALLRGIEPSAAIVAAYTTWTTRKRGTA